MAEKSPERAAKIAASKRGLPRPEHVRERLRDVNTGRKASAETRARMSAAHRRRGTRPPWAGNPWTAEKVALLGTMTDREVSQRIGRTLPAVATYRERLGIPPFHHRSPRLLLRTWAAADDALLGTMSDVALAAQLGCTVASVAYRRHKLGVSAFQPAGQ